MKNKFRRIAGTHRHWTTACIQCKDKTFLYILVYRFITTDKQSATKNVQLSTFKNWFIIQRGNHNAPINHLSWRDWKRLLCSQHWRQELSSMWVRKVWKRSHTSQWVAALAGDIWTGADRLSAVLPSGMFLWQSRGRPPCCGSPLTN